MRSIIIFYHLPFNHYRKMKSNSSYISDMLSRIHKSIEERDHELTITTLENLIQHIKPENAMSIALSKTQEYLPKFEVNYPDVKWPRHCLETLTHAMPKFETDEFRAYIPELKETFSDPGVGNFINSIEELWDAAQNIGNARTVKKLVADALANIIMADLATYWYQEQYINTVKSNESQPTEEDVPLKEQRWREFMNDPKVIDREAMLWQRIVAELERQFGN